MSDIRILDFGSRPGLRFWIRISSYDLNLDSNNALLSFRIEIDAGYPDSQVSEYPEVLVLGLY